MPLHADGPVSRLIERHLTPDLPAARFVANVTLVSIAGLVPTLALYVWLTPGFAAHLRGSEGALGAFLRQVATNGLPVVIALNYVSFTLLARLKAGTTTLQGIVAADLTARIGLFVALHAAIYAGSAVLFGSFGGDPARGLAVVAPTLVAAAGFGNLSGVYLYAGLVGALPLHMALAESAARRAGRETPTRGANLLLAIAIFGAQALALTLTARLLAALQTA